MQISRKTILSSAFLALAVTGSALALVAPPEPPAPGGGGGGGGERKRPKFEDLDKNNDGYITEDEAPSKEAWERLKKRDKDGDGKISKDEFGQGRPGGPRPGGPGPGTPPAPGTPK